MCMLPLSCFDVGIRVSECKTTRLLKGIKLDLCECSGLLLSLKLVSLKRKISNFVLYIFTFSLIVLKACFQFLLFIFVVIYTSLEFNSNFVHG